MDAAKKRKADESPDGSKESANKKRKVNKNTEEYKNFLLAGRWSHITLVIKEQYEEKLINDILKLSLDNIKKMRET